MAQRTTFSVDQLRKAEIKELYVKDIGVVFGFITVIGFAGYNENSMPYYLCKCVCGNDVLNLRSHILRGKIKSCGCKRGEIVTKNKTKHGFAPSIGKRDKIYGTWKHIKDRCYNPNNSHHYLYGGKGVVVCKAWREDFLNFYADMNPPTNKSIDRIDSNGNYSCGHCEECVANGWVFNCRWADDYTQSNNRSYNRKIMVNGQLVNHRQADIILGFPIKTISSRIRAGWTDEEAISIQPTKGTRRPGWINPRKGVKQNKI